VVLLSDSIRLFDEQGLNDIIPGIHAHLTDAANRASVVIYGIDGADCRLSPDRGRTIRKDERTDRPGPGENSAAASRGILSIPGRIELSGAETGGLFVHDTNDITGGMPRSRRSAGLLSTRIRSDDTTFQTASRTRGVRTISSREVEKSGLSIRSRTGLFGVPDQESLSRFIARAKSQLFAALGSPFGGGAVRLRRTALFANNPKEGSFDNLSSHEGRDLTFTDEPDDA